MLIFERFTLSVQKVSIDTAEGGPFKVEVGLAIALFQVVVTIDNRSGIEFFPDGEMFHPGRWTAGKAELTAGHEGDTDKEPQVRFAFRCGDRRIE